MKAFYETRQYETHIKIWHKLYEDMRFIAHWHPEIELIYIRRGSIEVTIEKETVKAKSGDLLIIDSGKIHFSSMNYKDNLLEFIIFDPAIINSVFEGFNLKSSLLTESMLNRLNIHSSLITLLDLINKEQKEKRKYYDEIIATAIKQFCLLLKRVTIYYVDPNRSIEKKERIDEFQYFLNYIESNSCENITLSKGASMLNVNASYFSTLFKEYTGSTFIKYLNAIRIENSIIQMKENKDTIIDIAYSNGFNNIRTFNRVFKDFTGLTPTDFLKSSTINHDNYLYQIRKSAHVKHTKEFDNKTVIYKNN